MDALWTDYVVASEYSVALEKVFQTMRLVLCFNNASNPSILTKHKAIIALRFFLKMSHFDYPLS